MVPLKPLEVFPSRRAIPTQPIEDVLLLCLKLLMRRGPDGCENFLVVVLRK